MYKEARRSAWVEINLTNLGYNIKNIQSKIGNREMIGVLKANAYGHGSVKVAEVLRENGCSTFAVATLQEAITLRENGAKEEIIVFGITSDMYADIIVDYDLTPIVCNSANAMVLSKEAEKKGKVISGLIAVDTGMGRIGYLIDELDYAIGDIQKIAELSNFKIKGLFSHLSVADAPDKTYSHQQETIFNKFYDAITAAGVEIPMRTLSNSAAIMELPTSYYDACRAGIIMYGMYPGPEVDVNELSLNPVMSVKGNIVYLKDVPAGFSVGYGRKYISRAPAKIATLTLGYADGYQRACAASAKVIVNGVFCPIAGNICMDQCMVDVTNVPEVNVGDEVIFMGTDGKNTILADDIAKAAGTISAEITCELGLRLPKVYVK